MMVAENLTTWGFHVNTLTWTAIETKPFIRWLLVREDESFNDLWGISQVAGTSHFSWPNNVAEEYREKFAARELTVNADLYDARFRPSIPHTVVEQSPDDEFGTYRIMVDDVIVRYVEDMCEIAVTVEGVLSDERLEELKRHGLETFTELEGVPYKCVPL